MSEREDENEDVFESDKDRHRASKGVVFEFPPRQHNKLKPFLVRKPMSSKSNGEDVSIVGANLGMKFKNRCSEFIGFSRFGLKCPGLKRF